MKTTRTVVDVAKLIFAVADCRDTLEHQLASYVASNLDELEIDDVMIEIEPDYFHDKHGLPLQICGGLLCARLKYCGDRSWNVVNSRGTVGKVTKYVAVYEFDYSR